MQMKILWKIISQIDNSLKNNQIERTEKFYDDVEKSYFHGRINYNFSCNPNCTIFVRKIKPICQMCNNEKESERVIQ